MESSAAEAPAGIPRNPAASSNAASRTNKFPSEVKKEQGPDCPCSVFLLQFPHGKPTLPTFPPKALSLLSYDFGSLSYRLLKVFLPLSPQRLGRRQYLLHHRERHDGRPASLPGSVRPERHRRLLPLRARLFDRRQFHNRRLPAGNSLICRLPLLQLPDHPAVLGWLRSRSRPPARHADPSLPVFLAWGQHGGVLPSSLFHCAL